MEGCDLNSTALAAMQAVRRMIELNIANSDKYKGIPVEVCLEVIDE